MTTLPQTFAIEIVDDVLPDLIEAVRNPHHPDSEALIKRARAAINNSWGTTRSLRGAVQLDACADTQFDTLLAVAETGFRLGWWR